MAAPTATKTWAGPNTAGCSATPASSSTMPTVNVSIWSLYQDRTLRRTCADQAPNREPWDETPRKLSPEDQARCYDAVFQAFYTKPWLQGIYWWKVGTNGYGGPGDGSHTPWGKPAMDVVKKWYTDGRR